MIHHIRSQQPRLQDRQAQGFGGREVVVGWLHAYPVGGTPIARKKQSIGSSCQTHRPHGCPIYTGNSDRFRSPLLSSEMSATARLKPPTCRSSPVAPVEGFDDQRDRVLRFLPLRVSELLVGGGALGQATGSTWTSTAAPPPCRSGSRPSGCAGTEDPRAARRGLLPVASAVAAGGRLGARARAGAAGAGAGTVVSNMALAELTTRVP